MLIIKSPDFGALLLYRKWFFEYLAKFFLTYDACVACVKIHPPTIITLWSRVLKFSTEKSVDLSYDFSTAGFADVSRQGSLFSDVLVDALLEGFALLLVEWKTIWHSSLLFQYRFDILAIHWITIPAYAILRKENDRTLLPSCRELLESMCTTSAPMLVSPMMVPSGEVNMLMMVYIHAHSSVKRNHFPICCFTKDVRAQ